MMTAYLVGLIVWNAVIVAVAVMGWRLGKPGKGVCHDGK